MASDSSIADDNKRQFSRQRCGTECTFVLDGMESRVYLLDASRGGFKLRFDQPEAAMAAILPVPRDMVIMDQYSKMHATVMWASGGLAGCRFYQHLSLDDVVRVMGGHFRLQLVPQAAPQPPAPQPPAPQPPAPEPPAGMPAAILPS